MKKLLGLMIAAAIIPWAASASATTISLGSTTNSDQQVNFTLNFYSQGPSNTTYLTNITHTGTGSSKVSATNITTNVTFTVLHKSVGTADVIASLLGANVAPAGATLVKVGNGTNTSYEVRYKLNRTVVTNFHSFQVDSVLAKSSKTKDGAIVAGSGTDYSLMGFGLKATPDSPLSFEVHGATLLTYSTITLGKLFSESVSNLTSDVVGRGTDAAGDHELVVGTITINGAVAKSEAILQ